MNPLRALLLTDAVDSTQVAQALGDDAMARHWAAHDRAARDLLPTWRGREIDKTDGMLLLFDSAADAAGYALAYHRALATLGLPFKARAGIHVGAVTLRANPPDDIARGAKPVEVDGLALPIAARVMSLALGGQTLLSGDARAALGLTDLRVQSHGHWRMQGVMEPIELFEIGAPGANEAPFTPPPDAAKVYRVVRQGELWQPVRQVRHSVPAERDSFVGRHEPLLDLARRLEGGARLVSVLGMGGTGKTRLVTRFAWTWLGEFPGGVWFCDLSQARSVDGIYFAVAQGLDVPLGKTDPVVQLGNAINGRGKCLVILDNFEQVARHAEETLGRWLDRAGQARFIVTTREALGIAGEQTLALAPLPVPHAVTLFEQRAAAAGGVAPTSAQDRDALAPLVALLDGLPLAIELAAARASVMSPQTLLKRMSERFKLLASRGGRQDRQATLRATLDWSWELLAEHEKATLAQLSVFEGGFTVEAAEAVVDLAGYAEAAWPVDVLHSLVDKSLLRWSASQRFDLLQSVHEYAAEHLRTAGRFAGSGPAAVAAAQQRHGAYFAALALLRAVDNGYADLDNLVVACRRAAQRGDGGVAVAALAGAWERLKLRGPYDLAIDLAASVRSVPALPNSSITLLERVTGSALTAAGKGGVEARAHFEVALAAATRAGDRRAELQAISCLAERDVFDGRMTDAAQHYEQALAGAGEIADRSFECKVLNGLGMCHEFLGDFDVASRYFEAGLTVAREAAERRWEGGSLGNLGQLHANRGHSAQARAYYDEALTIASELGDRPWEGNVRCNLGLLHFNEGRMTDARVHLDAALAASRELGYARLEAVVLCNLGIVMEALALPDDALSNHEQALRVARELRDRRSEGQFLGYLGLLHARQARFDQALACLESGEALLTALADRMSLGVLLCGRAEASHLAGDAANALAILRRAERLHEELGAEAESEFGIALKRVAKLLGRP